MFLSALLSRISLLWLATIVSAGHGSKSKLNKPNFVFIISDDQDLHLGSLDYMPYVQKHLGKGGTFYRRHYCTIAICCPSRVSLLTGRAAHNTNVTDVSPPHGECKLVFVNTSILLTSKGGYTKFISQGLNDKYLPVWLQDAGYNTYYTGKLMNGHSTSTWNKPLPAGWNGTDCTPSFLPSLISNDNAAHQIYSPPGSPHVRLLERDVPEKRVTPSIIPQ